MSIHTYYQATDPEGKPTGRIAPTKVLSWAVAVMLVALWGIYLWHLAHGHDAVLSAVELGGISVVGALLMAALYFAGRKMGEIGVQAAERRFGGDDG